MRLLHRFGHGRSRWEAPVLAPVFVVALPQRLHERKHLAHEGTTLRLRNAASHAIEFKLVGTAADPKLQPSVAQHVT
jgi:hypothetical protein